MHSAGKLDLPRTILASVEDEEDGGLGCPSLLPKEFLGQPRDQEQPNPPSSSSSTDSSLVRGRLSFPAEFISKHWLPENEQRPSHLPKDIFVPLALLAPLQHAIQQMQGSSAGTSSLAVFDNMPALLAGSQESSSSTSCEDLSMSDEGEEALQPAGAIAHSIPLPQDTSSVP